MTASRNTYRLLALAGVGIFGLLTLVGSGGGGGGGGESTPTPKAWRTALLIETDNAGDAQRPQIAMDGAGNALVVWMQSDGMRDNIWANRFGVGTGTWGGAQLIETVDTGNAQFPQIAMDGSGNAHAVWQQSDGPVFSIWANRFSAGTWGAAQLIEIDDVGDALFPQIAMDGSGNAFAVWRQSDGMRFNIQANRFSAGNWGAAEPIETDNTDHALDPQIAADGSGNAIAVWSQLGMETNIEANRFAAGGVGWGFAQLIDTFPGPASSPQITFDARRNALAVWQHSDGTRDSIWANRFDAGSGTWGTAQLIETDDTGDAQFPQIAFDGSGNAVAVWQQSDGMRINIWANRFD